MAEARAILRNVQSSPRKMRYVADMIRGMDALKALDVLEHSPKYGARPMKKLLRSAIDNWEKKNEGVRVEDARLFVHTIFVDGGRMLKRWLPAPHGRAYKMRKRSNHITIVVDSRVQVAEEVQPQVKEAAASVENTVETTKAAAPAKKTTRKKKEKAAASA
jgi:large subunit ribosomal protein L22